METNFLKYPSRIWLDEIDRIRQLLGAPNNPSLLPPHFLKVVFPEIGGRIVEVKDQKESIGFGFLFPKSLQDGYKEYLLRYHAIKEVDRDRLLRQLEELLRPESFEFYDPTAEQGYTPTSRVFDGFDIGHPSSGEAGTMREIHRTVWGSEEDFLYPTDIHSDAAGLAASLVARVDQKPVAFLAGLYQFGGSKLPAKWQRKFNGDFRIESQLLAVLPEYRRLGLGYVLKKFQGLQAKKQGIGIVNWTADPLQYRNARLNFGRLGAVAFDAYSDYMPFRNLLNQVAPSRIGITWLVATRRVENFLSQSKKSEIRNPGREPGMVKVNHGWKSADLSAGSPTIAFEIPSDWMGIQSADTELALKWRKTTDRLFLHYLGCDEGKYIITGVGEEEDRKYLIAERVTPELLEELGR